MTTLSAICSGAPCVGVANAGVKEQVAYAGKPVQARDTVLGSVVLWPNPAIDPSVSVTGGPSPAIASELAVIVMVALEMSSGTEDTELDPVKLLSPL
jgi:hypothetical protein